MIKLKVKFTNKLFSNDDGYSIIGAMPIAEDKKLVDLNKFGTITISGNFTIDDEELHRKVYTLSIEEDYKSKYPNSYKLLEIHYDFPNKAKDQWDYLKNSSLVTTLQFNSLKKTFTSKQKILDIIINTPKKITKVKGFSDKKATKLKEKLEIDKNQAVIYQEFGKIKGIGPALIKSISKMSPDIKKTIKNTKKDPFILVKLPGAGFVIADAVRSHLNIPLTDKNRCLHGIKYYIVDGFQQTGNTYADLNKELKDVAHKLNVSVNVLANYLKEDISDEKVNLDKEYGIHIFSHYITSTELFSAESIVYKKTQNMMKAPSLIMSKEQWEKNKQELLKNETFTLSEEQNAFLDRVNEHSISLLIGPGGAGKSWVTKIAYDLAKKAELSVGLFAPTARAAKAMTDYVGQRAYTIHKGLLPYVILEGENFAPYDLIIIDETSMVDSELMAIVYKAMSSKARLIIIGDDFQLPSVGPGNILYDFINSLKVPTTKLTKIYRQDEDSNIVNYASALRDETFDLDELMPEIDSGDIVFINKKDTNEMKDIALNYYEKAYKDNKQEEIMMLTPVNNTEIGRNQLNKEIQRIVNGNKKKDQMIFGQNLPEDERRYFRKGDYISITKNNYGREAEDGSLNDLINGDIGYITEVNQAELLIIVDDKEYSWGRKEIVGNIDHFWATTIHKSQGGQANVVIILIPKNSFMISANMLYTAITRTKEKCIVIGDFDSINKSAHRFVNFKRKTMLELQSSLSSKKKG